MHKGAPVAALAIKAATLLERVQPKIFKKSAHGGEIGRCEAHMRDVLNLDNRHSRFSRFLLDYLVK
jgi:hypothetical protein